MALDSSLCYDRPTWCIEAYHHLVWIRASTEPGHFTACELCLGLYWSP